MNFHSTRLSYRPYTPDDEKLYTQLTTSADLMKYISGEPHSEAVSIERFQKTLKINADETASEVYAVFHKESQAYVGLAKFVFTKPGQVEIGYVLRKKFWGQQYGTEVSKTMVSLCKHKKGVKELVALIDPENIASKRILEKCGLKFKEFGTYEGLPSATYHRIMTID